VRIAGRWAAERADDARCDERLGACLDVDRDVALPRGGCFTPAGGAVFAARAAVAVAGAGRVVRSTRAGPRACAWSDRGTWVGRGVWVARGAWVGRGVRPERSDEGRPAGARRESVSGGDVAERSLRAAGVTAVGVMVSSDLQLAGGAQVR
jgi:hypothetical protein